MAIYFQCYAFHGASIYDTFHETSNRDDYGTVQWNSSEPSFQSVLEEISACAAVYTRYVKDACD